MKLIEKAMTLLLVPVFLVPGVYGVNFGIVSSGNGGSSGSVGIGIGAAKDALVNGQISVNGASQNPIITIAGISTMAYAHQVTDSVGNHAEVHANWVNGQDMTYGDRIQPGEGNLGYSNGFVTAEQWLTGGQADYIKCSQSASTSASNPLGSDQASTSIEINSGSLTNYYGLAYAGFKASEGQAYADFAASAGQSFDGAAGKTIDVEEHGTNVIGSIGTSTKISDGAISHYADEHAYYFRLLAPLALHTPDGDGWCYGAQDFDSAYGKTIELTKSSSNPDGSLLITAKTTIIGLGSENGIITHYNGQESAGKANLDPDENYFNAGDFGSTMSGYKIDFDSSASDTAGDKATASAQLLHGTFTNVGNGGLIYLTEAMLLAGQDFLGGIAKGAVKLDAKATNAAGVTAQKKGAFGGPKNAFGNIAQVDLSTSTPTVNQGKY